FVGAPAMNVVDGVVVESGAAVRLGANGAAAVPLDRPRPGAAGRALKVGLRPEHLVPNPKGPLALSIELVENLGADALLYGKVPGGATLVARVEGAAPYKAGGTLQLDVSPRQVHLFDAESGRRVDS